MNASTEQDVRRGWTSASNAQSDRLCPGRHNAQKGLPDLKGEWASYGAEIHAALADSGNPALMQKLTPAQRDMFDSHREVEKKLIEQVWADEPDGPTRVWRHERYWANVPTEQDWQHQPIGQVFKHSGEADFIMRRGRLVLIQDYKSLAGDVAESPKNEQLRDLAVMAWRVLMPEEVIVAINQPLVTWTPELCRYTKVDLERAEQEMWARVRKSNDPASPRIPGEVQCRYCKARSVCKEYAAWAPSLLPARQRVGDVPVASWTPEQRAAFCEGRTALKKWVSECEEAMEKLLQADPDAIPGWELKPGQVRESVTQPQELFSRFRALALPRAQAMEKDSGQSAESLILGWFMQAVAITKGKLEERVRDVADVKGKALKAKMEELLAGLVESKQNSPSLARKKE